MKKLLKKGFCHIFLYAKLSQPCLDVVRTVLVFKTGFQNILKRHHLVELVNSNFLLSWNFRFVTEVRIP